jgi:hypothetical protein
MSNLERFNRRAAESSQSSPAYEQLISGIREFAGRQPAGIPEFELDTLIEQTHSIENDPKIQEIYGLLVDLRIALFRPELNPSGNPTSPSSLMERLRAAISVG